MKLWTIGQIKRLDSKTNPNTESMYWVNYNEVRHYIGGDLVD